MILDTFLYPICFRLRGNVWPRSTTKKQKTQEKFESDNALHF